jgi:hypothetical protein
MGLQENLLKGIYKYGNYSYTSIICAFISGLETLFVHFLKVWGSLPWSIKEESCRYARALV